MKFSEIISISGQPGLFRFLTQNRSGIVVESLTDKRRFPVPTTSRVSSLREIAIYTEEDDIPLSEVYEKIYEKEKGAVKVDAKTDGDGLRKAIAIYLPAFDKERVHTSDLKKLFSWYNLLVGAGMTEFVEKEEEETKEEEENK